ncbi:MFS transporter [Streptomyces sp. CBMAI 2042]|uniref:MFS transporter n=1 Tax=Streptomyces sp. CBMAI 2042 TaxID=2305222 RepID=UPI001F001B20|nr:MFS transporter [Streptomyces sp. CBMAI 2042]
MQEQPLRATRKEWIGLAVLALPSMLVTMDLTLLHLAVPQIGADLDPSSSELLWITDIYGFFIAGFLVTMGTLGDRVGRRRMLLLGALAFGVASVATAYAQSPEMLIVTRALLGVAGATLAPSTLSLIRNMFPLASQRTVAITIWSVSFMLGGALGPVVGGILLEYFWWGSVFLLAVPVMVLLLAVGPFLLPEFRSTQGGRVDLSSSLLSMVAVLSVIYGLKEVAKQGPALVPLAVIVFGLAVGYAFVRRQDKLESPLLNLRLFANRAFSVSLLTLLLTVMFLMGIQFLIAQYFQSVLGLSPLEAGLRLLPAVVAGMIAALGASAVVTKVRPAYVFGAGLLVATAGFITLFGVSAESGSGTVVLASILMFAGLAPVSALGIDMIVGAAPPEQAGPAAAISETSNEFGGALGIAVLGSIGTTVFRGSMADSYPDGVPAGADDTLVGALEGAARLPGEAGEALATAAREAFAAGLQVNSYLAVPLMLLLAVGVTFLLRDVKPAAQEEQDLIPAADGAPGSADGVDEPERSPAH